MKIKMDNEVGDLFHNLENLVSSIGMGISFLKKGDDNINEKMVIIEKINERTIKLADGLENLKIKLKQA